MAANDIVQYNLRLNLNNPIHLKIHQRLLNVNTDIYKSKNKYLVKTLYRGLFGENENFDEIKELEPINLKDIVQKKELPEIERRIEGKIMEEMIKLLYSSISHESNIPMQLPERKEKKNDSMQELEGIDESLAEIACGYFE